MLRSMAFLGSCIMIGISTASKPISWPCSCSVTYIHNGGITTIIGARGNANIRPIRALNKVVTVDRSATVQRKAIRNVIVQGVGICEIQEGASVALAVCAPENLLDCVVTEVSGTSLIFRMREGCYDLSNGATIRCRLTLPREHFKSLILLKTEGTAQIIASKAPLSSMSLEASGESSIRLGDVSGDHLTIEASGASHVGLNKVVVAECKVDISGASHMLFNSVTAHQGHFEASGKTTCVLNHLDGGYINLKSSGCARVAINGGKMESCTAVSSGVSSIEGSRARCIRRSKVCSHGLSSVSLG